MSDPIENRVNGKRCLSCMGTDIHMFYSVKKVPVHSVVLLRSRQEALDFPKGEICLGFCRQCGFISNLAFDAKLQDYSNEYEATQAYSATFNRFNRQLANDLIDHYQLSGKHIVEIGCGQGEFLSMLCEDGTNTGVGFDPAYEPERQLGSRPGHVKIIPDYYSEKYSDYQADFICCKMTLEHIHPTFDFVSTVRRSIGERFDTVVFFQIPNARYVYGDLAFWDVYYEHCSYFSKSSVANLFTLAGFDVHNLWLDYQDQYLMIEAKPSTNKNSQFPNQEDDLFELSQEVKHFSRLVPQKKSQWLRSLQEFKSNQKRIVLWGGGSKAVAFLTSLNLHPNIIEFAVDINPHKMGTFLPGTGQEVVFPDQLRKIRPDVVIIMNPVYRLEVQTQLDSMNLAPQVLTVQDI